MLDQLKYFDGKVSTIDAIPAELKPKYKEAFEVDPIWALKLAAARGKWIDQSQSHNVFMTGTSGKQLSETYLGAWKMGLKTTYYLLTLAATQIEKSTLDAAKFGYTQKRDYVPMAASPQTAGNGTGVHGGNGAEAPAAPEGEAAEGPQLCRVDDPDCEACQ